MLFWFSWSGNTKILEIANNEIGVKSFHPFSALTLCCFLLSLQVLLESSAKTVITAPEWVTQVQRTCIPVKQRMHLIPVQGKPWILVGICDWGRLGKGPKCSLVLVGENSWRDPNKIASRLHSLAACVWTRLRNDVFHSCGPLCPVFCRTCPGVHMGWTGALELQTPLKYAESLSVCLHHVCFVWHSPLSATPLLALPVALHSGLETGPTSLILLERNFEQMLWNLLLPLRQSCGNLHLEGAILAAFTALGSCSVSCFFKGITEDVWHHQHLFSLRSVLVPIRSVRSLLLISMAVCHGRDRYFGHKSQGPSLMQFGWVRLIWSKECLEWTEGMVQGRIRGKGMCRDPALLLTVKTSSGSCFLMPVGLDFLSLVTEPLVSGMMTSVHALLLAALVTS